MQDFDIRSYKASIRQTMKNIRLHFSPETKEKKDKKIFERFKALYQYRNAKIVLCFMSTKIEINTEPIINDALMSGKEVAVPRCIPGTRYMEFFFIKGTDDLEKGAFGVMEPIPDRCEKVTSFNNSICVLPALAIDHTGYRLGYGAGYYDRFLSGYNGLKIGVIYNECIVQNLMRGRHDIPVDIIVSERYIRKVSCKRKRKFVPE